MSASALPAWAFRRGIHYGMVVAAAASLAVMAGLGLGRLAYPVVLPVMQHDLGLSTVQSGLLAASNLVGYVAGAPLGGLLASRYGASRTIVGGLCITGVALGLLSLAPSVPLLVPAQFLAGVGTGLSVVPGVGLLTAWFAPARRGRASGVMSSGTGVALLLAGLLLPSLMGAERWRLAWLVLGGIVLGIALVCAATLRDLPAQVGLTPIGGITRADTPVAESAASARARVVRAPVFWLLGGCNALFGLAYTSYTTFLVVYLVRSVGLSQPAAGAVWGAVGISSILGGPLWGVLSDRLGRPRTFTLTFALFCAAYLATALAPGSLGYVAAPLLFGLTFFATPTLMGPAAGDYFGPRLVFAVYGLLNLFSGVGQVLGPLLGGVAADLSGELSAAFLVAAVSGLGALALSLGLPPAPIADGR